MPNRKTKKYVNEERNYFKEDGYLTSISKEIEKNKIRTIYRIALDNNHDSLVLLDAGVFNLLFDEVSTLFKEVLDENEFTNKFKVVSFAIYEKESKRKIVGRNGEFKPFYDIFEEK